MKLYNILGNYPVIKTYGPLDIDIFNIEHDSRNISKNNLFIAQRGFKNDGHNFINKAIENGAIGVLGEREIYPHKNVTMIKVEDSTDALGYIGGNFYNWPFRKANTVGITGTNGKTSTSYYIKNILNTYNSNIGILGTIGGEFNNKTFKLTNTTPDSLEIQRLVYQMTEKDVEYIIMEVSSHALALKRVEYMDFDIGIFTNLSQDHLDYHKTMEDYFNSKLKLFNKTKRYNIINTDDKYGKIIKDSVKNRIPYITYGFKEPAMIYGDNITYTDKGIDFTLNLPKESREINLKIPGEFSLYNSLAAAACGYAFNIDIDTIKKGLDSFNGVKGRFEIIPNKLGLNIIIDFAHTPEGLEAILKTIKKFTKGELYVVFGAGGNRDKEKRPEMGKVVGNYADLSIITTDNPRFENPEDIIKDIVKGTKNTNGKYIEIVDRKEAIEYAILKANPKDTILLAGKGHETNIIIGDKYFSFDERKIVENISNKI